MCIIIAKPAGTSLDNIKNTWLTISENNNPHGIGLMFSHEGRLRIVKGFEGTAQLMDYLVKNVTDADALAIHYRWATSGLRDAGNCHPFPVVDDCELMRSTELLTSIGVCHNGVIGEYNGKHERYSDTMLFIREAIYPVKDRLLVPGVQKMIGAYLKGDRLCVIHGAGTMTRWGAWTEENGIYFSNTGYKIDRTKPVEIVPFHERRPAPIQSIYAECDSCGKDKQVQLIGESWLCGKCQRKHRNRDIDRENPLCEVCNYHLSTNEMRKLPSGKWRCKRCDALSNMA